MDKQKYTQIELNDRIIFINNIDHITEQFNCKQLTNSTITLLIDCFDEIYEDYIFNNYDSENWNMCCIYNNILILFSCYENNINLCFKYILSQININNLVQLKNKFNFLF